MSPLILVVKPTFRLWVGPHQTKPIGKRQRKIAALHLKHILHIDAFYAGKFACGSISFHPGAGIINHEPLFASDGHTVNRPHNAANTAEAAVNIGYWRHKHIEVAFEKQFQCKMAAAIRKSLKGIPVRRTDNSGRTKS